MEDSGILQEVIKIKKVNKANASHFALCNGDKVRYFIDLNSGKERLSSNISTYSGKLKLVMKMLKIFPLEIFQIFHLGYFANVKLEKNVESKRKKTKTKYWNVIVGTYDSKQKLVLQCFNEGGPAFFIKVGNSATDCEMRAEIKYLKDNHSYKNFGIPMMTDYCFRENKNNFNIQITKEFAGEKVEPILDKKIIDIYIELSKDRKANLEFSHGDFAPWNLKNCNGKYILFDWEHCGYRMAGFDLMHYAIIIEIVLNQKNVTDAFGDALDNIHRFIPEFSIDKESFFEEFKKLRTQIM